MKTLLDNCVPWSLRRWLIEHDVSSAHAMGWARLRNGELMQTAAAAGFLVFLTVDQGVQFQQNLKSLPINVILIRAASNNVEDIAIHAAAIRAAFETLERAALVDPGIKRLIRIP